MGVGMGEDVLRQRMFVSACKDSSAVCSFLQTTHRETGDEYLSICKHNIYMYSIRDKMRIRARKLSHSSSYLSSYRPSEDTNVRIRAIRGVLKRYGKKGIWIAQLHREVNAILKQRKTDPIRRQTIGYLLYGYERSYMGKDGRERKQRAGGYLLGEIEIVGVQGNNFLIRHKEGARVRISGQGIC